MKCHYWEVRAGRPHLTAFWARNWSDPEVGPQRMTQLSVCTDYSRPRSQGRIWTMQQIGALLCSCSWILPMPMVSTTQFRQPPRVWLGAHGGENPGPHSHASSGLRGKVFPHSRPQFRHLWNGRMVVPIPENLGATSMRSPPRGARVNTQQIPSLSRWLSPGFTCEWQRPRVGILSRVKASHKG